MQDILVVDDEASVVEVVGLYLKREGFSVRTAGDGNKALAAIDEKTPALVVLDLMLPQVDGIEIMHRLRDRQMANIPVIMLTARSFAIEQEQQDALQISGCLSKPFSPKELLGNIEDILYQKELVGDN